MDQDPVPNQEVDNSEDDKLGEAEALKVAESQGITFVDTFFVTEVATFSQVSDSFDTREEAEAEFKKKFNDPERYTITQSRQQS